MKKKSIFRIRNNGQAVAAGIIGGIISVAVIICLLSAVLVKFDVPTDYVRYLWFVPAVLAGFISGAVTGKHVKTKGFLWGCISSFAVALICIAVLLAVNSFCVELLSFLIIPVFALTGSIGGIVSANLR